LAIDLELEFTSEPELATDSVLENKSEVPLEYLHSPVGESGAGILLFILSIVLGGGVVLIFISLDLAFSMINDALDLSLKLGNACNLVANATALVLLVHSSFFLHREHPYLANER
jgi:hypothetical protein